MFKHKLYSCIIIFITIILVSSFCFATDDTLTTTLTEGTSETTTNNTTDGDSNESTENSSPIVENNYVNTDYFKADTNVILNENTIIDGNAYIVGENVTIQGRIVGDLFVVAKKLTIQSSYVYTNVFACASDITIKNESVVYNLYATCENLLIDENAIIYRDLTAAASNITIKGSIGRDAKLSTSSLSLVTPESSHNIYGNLTYSSREELQIPEGSVSGEVKFNKRATIAPVNTIKNYGIDLLKALIITSLAFLFIVFLIPKFTKKATNLLTTKPGITVGIGFLVLIAVPIFTALFIITIIGIPISLALIFTYILLIYFSFAILSVVIANIIMNKLGKTKKIFFYLLTLAVAVILFLVKLIPYAGWIVNLAAIVLNLGICMKSLLPNKKEKLIEPAE